MSVQLPQRDLWVTDILSLSCESHDLSAYRSHNPKWIEYWAKFPQVFTQDEDHCTVTSGITTPKYTYIQMGG